MMEGRIQKTTFQGDATVESLDPDTVTKLLHYLELNSQVTSSSSRQDANELHTFELFLKWSTSPLWVPPLDL